MKRPTRRARDHRRRRGNPPRRRAFLAVLVGTALGSPLLTRAQEKAKRVIGFLIGSSLPPPTKTAFGAAFHSGLEAIGYVEGENLTVEYRASAEELIADNVEVIIVASGGSIRQVQRATQSIPIVFIQFDLPLSAGLVASFSRPGGNITGVSMLMSGLMPKGITKRVGVHTLRHCFATHLLEQKTDIRIIQVLFGHKKLETTALYTRVAISTIGQVTSPLDFLRKMPG